MCQWVDFRNLQGATRPGKASRPCASPVQRVTSPSVRSQRGTEGRVAAHAHPAAGARSPRGPRLDERAWGPPGVRTALPPLPPPSLCSESPVGPPRPPRGPPPAFLPASPSCGAAASSIIDARPRLTSASGLPSARSPARPSRPPPPAPGPAARFLHDCHKGKQRRSSPRWGPADAAAPVARAEGCRKGSRALAPRSRSAPGGLQDAGRGCSFADALGGVDHIPACPGTAFLTLVEGAAVLTPGELLRAVGRTGCLSLSVTRED